MQLRRPGDGRDEEGAAHQEVIVHERLFGQQDREGESGRRRRQRLQGHGSTQSEADQDQRASQVGRMSQISSLVRPAVS
jgi:hypothetical protein